MSAMLRHVRAEGRARAARFRERQGRALRVFNADRMRAYRLWQRGLGPHPRDCPELHLPLYRLLYPVEGT